MKHSAIISSLAILIASLPLAGCLSYDDTPTTNWNAHSQAGIPVKTRLKGQDEGFRFFFIGTSPSEQTAIDTVSPSGSDSDATVSSAVKVQGNGYTGFFSEVIEDPEKVENIKSVMKEICGTDFSSGKYEAPAGALPQPGGNAVPEKPNENKSTPSYTVTVISPEGEKVYRISGKELTNEEKGSQITLTDEQLKEITSLLFE